MMNPYKRSLAIAAFALPSVFSPALLQARQWSDQSGEYKVDADLVASDAKQVVLRTAEDGLLVFQIDQLSKQDQAFLADSQAKANMAASKAVDTETSTEPSNEKIPLPSTDSSWRLIDGHAINGRLLGFGTQTLILKRRDAEVMVNNIPLKELPRAYAVILPTVIQQIDNVKIKTPADLEDHLIDLGTGPLEYDVRGIQLALPDGGKITIPPEILVSEDAAAIRPGYDRWVAAQADTVDESSRDSTGQFERLMLDSYGRMASNATQSNVVLNKARLMDLQLQAATAGVTDIWQVGLIPRVAYRYPTTVVVYGQNSQAARIAAAAKYPGWQVGPIRKLSY
ncbi:SHD1 domain-containing protein [Rhodopirellula sp. MGV]|uniref:SHD1 domain-containing protein n=1 Tax=Rhodopirellula sp. MGV TaxID=2023130 RepID=UPI000B96A0E7|nr:SHD1 domain-containing protein [Rhodopirellula sp. MGV]OYP37734.1 hypothetical protein CGZ80_04435 [Rhodopirellula sp. MGV]PNY37172.1 hypothetical protein C2E31_09290 [Rhodopirellula baltica]